MNIRDLEVGSWVNSHVTETIDSALGDKNTYNQTQVKPKQFPMKNISPGNSPVMKTRELPKLPDKNYKKVQALLNQINNLDFSLQTIDKQQQKKKTGILMLPPELKTNKIKQP